MKHPALAELSIDELVGRFAEIGVAQDHVLLHEPISKFKPLYKQMESIENELRTRGRDARLALCRLYDHRNMQVRVIAAKATLAVAPEKAREALEAISKSNWYPQAGDAGMCLWNLDRGVFKPT
ncbi:MAG TPA: DUF2019 domain-containing protein [Stellaceae bacterium]|nr:DUF2019 domain-containing protein [Stellaceae bacterium]